jgi:hypothetical protein
MSQKCDVLVTKGRNAVFIHRAPVCRLGLLVSLLGVLKSLPRSLLPCFVILLVVGLCGTTMSVGGTIVQLSGALVVLVM